MGKYNIQKSKNIWEVERTLLPGGCHFNFHGAKMIQNIYYVKGDKSRLWDVDGNEYLDLYAKSGTMILGHNNQNYNNKMKDALDEIVSVNDTPRTIHVLNQIKQCMPSLEMMRFSLSGTEAVQNALRLARAYTKKQKIVRFWGHFHGSADNILGNLFDDNYVPFDDLSETNSTEGRFQGALNETIIIPWNDIEILKKILSTKGNEIAAVIMEPIMVNNGSIMPKEGYLQQVRKLCDENSVLLIFDEVITGFRVGIGGAQELFQVVPDLSIVGKAISNGTIPVSIIGGKKEIMEQYEKQKVVHLGTYNGYPLAIAAIESTLCELMDNNNYKHMQIMSDELRKIMLDTAKIFSVPLTIQGPHLCMSFHFKDKEIIQYKPDKREVAKKALFYSSCMSHGILFAAPSRIYLNTLFDSYDLEFFQKRIYDVFNETHCVLS